MNLTLDILLCLVILFVVVGSRFNKWPAAQSNLFAGKPSDYIDDLRYRAFCLLYVLTFFVLTAVLYSFPEFLRFFPGAENQGITLSYTFCSMIVVSGLAQQKISAYDEQWRQKLHEWARIPRYVEETAREIIFSDNFLPTESYLAALEKDFNREDNSLATWVEAIKNIESEKAQHSIEWHYLKCACLLLIIKETCNATVADNLKAKIIRIEELGRLIPLVSPHSGEIKSYQTELEDMSRHFVECLCKYLIKKYPRADEQYSAFKNLGFMIRQHDSTEVSVKNAIVWCVFGVIFVSVCSVIALLIILDARNPSELFTPERFFTWTLGSVVSFVIAIFVGLLVKKMPSRQFKAGTYSYFTTLLLATLASFIYFRVAQDLGQLSAQLPYARFIMALSFSTLSIVVVKALSNVSEDRRDVILSSLVHGFALAVAMAIFQALTSIAFSWDRLARPESLADLFSREDGKLMMVGLVGLFKGFFVGGGISYVIQETQRRQLLEALRLSPRVDRVLVAKLKMGAQEFNISTRDISKSGAKIRSRHKMVSGESVSIQSPVFGSIEGVIRWTRNIFWGRQMAGVEFTGTPSKLHKYIREQYGEYYA